MRSCDSKKVCEVCGREISVINFSKHLRSHQNHPENYENKKYALIHDGLVCQFCGKECKNRNSLCNHERLCKENPNRQVVVGFGATGRTGRTAWNKGLTKETDSRVAVQASTAALKFKDPYIHGSWYGRHHTAESRRKIALATKGNTNGNRSKKGYYKNIWCGSSYELIYLIYCLDHCINIKRCDKFYEYEYEGKTHLYFPDFIVDDSIIEIKGYHTDLVDIKTASVTDMPIKILYKKDLIKEFEYVFTTYNVNIANIQSLFDKNKQ